MRVLNFTLVLIGLLGLFFIAQVAGHGHLSSPLSSDSVRSGSDQDAPVAFPLASDFVCRNDNPLPSSQWTTLTAGQQSSMTWSMQAAHPGDCFAYISYDADLPDTQKRWFKVGQWRDCNYMNGKPQPFMVPAGLPSCEHCVLRWEWYALHLQQIGTVEFYAQCADVKIAGSSSGQLPSPQVTIPGHIPMNAKFYRDPYGVDASTGGLIGPPLATIGGASYSCASTYDSSCTTAPVNNNPCVISHQRCVTSTTFQACQIGSTTTVWGPAQSCQTGLVCADAGDNAHIFCVNPGTTPAYTPAPTPVPVSTPVQVPTPVPTPVSTPVSPKPSPSTTGSKVRPAPTPVSTGMPVSVPVPTPVSTPVTNPSTQACHLGDQVCVGSSQYQTCTNGRDANYWAAPQECRSGLTCHPSTTSNNIYCY